MAHSVARRIGQAAPAVALSPSPGAPVRLVTLCTGNSARSVMLQLMLSTIDPDLERWVVRSAGTHTAEDMGVSARTIAAVAAIEPLDAATLRSHRTHQLTEDDLAWCDAVLAVEADHVAYCRARYPAWRDRVVHLGTFCRYAPIDVAFAEQVRLVAPMDPDDTLDVADPAGKDQEDYDRCAESLWELAEVFATVTDPS